MKILTNIGLLIIAVYFSTIVGTLIALLPYGTIFDWPLWSPLRPIAVIIFSTYTLWSFISLIGVIIISISFVLFRCKSYWIIIPFLAFAAQTYIFYKFGKVP
jgi:hypothetical protein